MKNSRFATPLIVIMAVLVVCMVTIYYFSNQPTGVSPTQPTLVQVTSAPTSEFVINGIVVPPEPDPTINNATLAGVDSNNNGVRDDVERVMAKEFGGTSDYPFAMEYARQYQLNIVSPTPATRSEALQFVARELCASEGASSRLWNFDMDLLIVNTQIRRDAEQALDDVLSGFGGREVPGCETLDNAR